MGAPLFLPRRQASSQPQRAVTLDRSHPLFEDLVFAWFASAGDIDLVTGKAATIDGTKPAEQPFVSRLGRKFVGAGNLNFGTRPDLSFAGLSNQAIFAEVFIPDTGNVSNFICGRVVSNWDYFLNVSSANQQFGFGTGGQSSPLTVPAASVGGGLLPYQGRPVPLFGTYDKTTAKFYVDGILKNSAALSTAFPNDTDQFAIGARGGGNQTSSQLSGALVSCVLLFKSTPNADWAASLSANPSQLLATPRRMLYLASSAADTTLAGTASCSSSASGSLSTQVNMAGSASAQAAAQGVLSTSIPLGGSAGTVVSASGALASAVRLGGTCQAQASVSGALSTGINLTGMASGAVSASGALTTAIRLAGVASVGTGVTADLATGDLALDLAGVASCGSSMSGDLQTALTLSATAQAVSSALGVLSSDVRLAGVLQAQSSLSGAPTTSIPLSGVCAVQAGVIGALTTGLTLAGLCAVQAEVVGVLTAPSAIPPFSTDADLDRALRKAVRDCGLGLPIAMENTAFEKPANGAPWAYISIARGSRYPATLGPFGVDECEGKLLLDLYFPLFTGTADAGEAEQRLAEFFKLGRSLTHNYTAATVLSCGRVRDTEVDGYFRRTDAISWQAFLDRAR
jgi:hypothetical protein